MGLPRRRLTAPPEEALVTTRIGLRIRRVVAYDVWAQAGLQIARVHTSTAWCLGDWVVYGQSRYEDRYRTAVEAAGLDYQTLRNYAWVARRFAYDRRRKELSFQHHAEVASLPPEEQDRWLEKAVKLGWSRNQLRKNVRAEKKVESTSDCYRVLGMMEVTPEQEACWRRAADLSHRSLEEWALAHLDAAAARISDR
ncbi:LmbU family transcriptional regulator [Streptomyces sp. NPDC058440]|uniref:LmbU family transcriptional regulator n=1 Tax=Streptomyces sp. NPDC058440 TaxID=3346501 RepID=UPI003648FB9B